MLNYAVDPALLAPYVPDGTVLDAHGGITYVSLVAFQFEHTRVLGIPVPLHRDFEELNLRFYVRREHQGEVRRAVVFIREVVPRRAIALIARALYNEPYIALPMRHRTGGDEVVEVALESAVSKAGPSQLVFAKQQEENRRRNAHASDRLS